MLDRSSDERQPGQFLAPYELALPAICGQTGKLFLMVAERKPGEVLELVRSVAVQDGVSGAEMQRLNRNRWPQMQPDALGRASPIFASQDKPGEFQPSRLNANVEIGDNYPGCPYCRSTGYFHCSNCGLFSCWNKYNRRQHLEHHDFWCEGCKSWRCLSDEDDEDSTIELTGFARQAITGRGTQRSIAEAGVGRPLLPSAGRRRLR